MDDVKIREVDEIDALIDCPCGASFYVYVPDTPNECPGCKKIYFVELSVREVDWKEAWRIQPQRIRDE